MRSRGAEHYRQRGGLEHLATVDVLALVLVLALAIYLILRLLHAIAKTPRQKRARWPLALGAVGLAVCWGIGATADALVRAIDAEEWQTFEQVKAERGVWESGCAGACAALSRDRLEGVGTDRVVLHERWRSMNPWLPVYYVFDVWPVQMHTVGAVRGDTITWEGGHRERMEVVDGKLRLLWVR